MKEIILANPRGFCAGVERAVKIVERCLAEYGAPIYVRHEIVHNRHVVANLREQGVKFVAELEDIPASDKDRPVIFSAHGVSADVLQQASYNNMFFIDATCPLVSRVHKASIQFHKQGYHILLIGHAGHPEVIGTIGQLPDGCITLIETEQQAANIQLPAEMDKIAYVTQTTLSVDDTAEIIAVLKRRFPTIKAPGKDSICYATTNRQQVVKEIIRTRQPDAMIIIGAENSSNSRRLVEVARLHGCPFVVMVNDSCEIDWLRYRDVDSIGLTAGASAPEYLVQDLVSDFRNFFGFEQTRIVDFDWIEEDVVFKLPPIKRQVTIGR